MERGRGSQKGRLWPASRKTWSSDATGCTPELFCMTRVGIRFGNLGKVSRHFLSLPCDPEADYEPVVKLSTKSGVKVTSHSHHASQPCPPGMDKVVNHLSYHPHHLGFQIACGVNRWGNTTFIFHADSNHITMQPFTLDVMQSSCQKPLEPRKSVIALLRDSRDDFRGRQPHRPGRPALFDKFLGPPLGDQACVGGPVVQLPRIM